MPDFLWDCWPSLEIIAVLCAMGCIQSIGGKARVFREGITVIDVKASIDPIPTSIDESSSVVLRYRTPHFRASAQVVMPPIPKKETWIVGWIQACSHMEFYNQYGEQGMSSWELPDLQEGKIEAISDSDGVNYPWYGNTTETCTIVGPTKRDSKFIISMNDNFYPSVTWAVPVSESNVAKLTNIYRDQSFTTWLVATNTSTNDMIILQTLHWRMQLSIEVNPNRPLGQRARLREPIAQDQPKILSKNEPIPPARSDSRMDSAPTNPTRTLAVRKIQPFYLLRGALTVRCPRRAPPGPLGTCSPRGGGWGRPSETDQPLCALHCHRGSPFLTVSVTCSRPPDTLLFQSVCLSFFFFFFI